ncbi:Fic family protein [Dyella sp. OK004]|uniref:Fic family protein n=1 Tax=Dyella sp. OK004 TaxID=1855292 RepID=UPI0008EC543E|nr:Fic family protein [Dyella sp. OK004]SFR86378.1 Fic family protein [Dyella sp. OK004]
MKLPVAPPPWNELFDRYSGDLVRIMSKHPGPEVKGRYEHWDHLRHLSPPDGLTAEQWWLGIKMARIALQRRLPLEDKTDSAFKVVLSDSIQRKLFLVARDAAGALRGQDGVQSDSMRERYLVRSLMEEAMTSSQLEGAATTTQVAKDMLRSGRQPRDYGERMIWNNYVAMRELKEWRQRPLTPDAIFEMHRMLTEGTLEDEGCAGRLRREGEDIVVEDETGHVLHVPPLARELPARLQALCNFANQTDDDEHFIHPVVRAIIIHFQIGYDHPFVDGNGRTARTLFYWSMLRSGFWMSEYLSISSILKRAPAQYIRSYLYTETDSSDTTYFVSHQLDVLLEAIDGVHGYIARKQRDQEDAAALLKPGSKLARQLNHRQRALLLNALKHPEKLFTIDVHRRTHDTSYQTARADLLGLVDAGLMDQHRQGKAFVFIARPNLGKKLRG